MPLRNYIDLRFRQTDETGQDLDGNAPVEVTLLDGLPVNVVQGAGVAAEDFLPGQLALSTSAKRIVDRRSTRTRIVILNMDAAIVLTVGTAGVTTANGIPLAAGASVALYTKADIWVVAASGTPTVSWLEEYN